MRFGLVLMVLLAGCAATECECLVDAHDAGDDTTRDVCLPQEGTSDDGCPNDADAELPPPDSELGGEYAACKDLPRPSLGACLVRAESGLPPLPDSAEQVVVGTVDAVIDGTPLGGCMQTQRFVIGTASSDNPTNYTVLLTDDDGVQWALEVALPTALPPAINTRVRVEVAIQEYSFAPSCGFLDLSTEDGKRMWWIGEAGTVSTLQPPAAMRFRQGTMACTDSFEHCGSWAGYDVMVEDVSGTRKVPYGGTVQVGSETVINGGVELQTTTVTTCPDWYHGIAIMAVLWPDSLVDPCGSCGIGSTCLYGACTTPCSPVDAQASCQDALACLDACVPDSGFPACRGMCISNLGTPGMGEFQVLAQCAVTKCQATDDAPWNTDCLDADCADEMAGCDWGCTFNDCDSLWSCVKGCVSAPDSPGLAECRQTCAREALTTAQVPLLRVFECALPSCHEECDLPGDSACITCLEATAGSSCADEWRLCQG